LKGLKSTMGNFFGTTVGTPLKRSPFGSPRQRLVGKSHTVPLKGQGRSSGREERGMGSEVAHPRYLGGDPSLGGNGKKKKSENCEKK